MTVSIVAARPDGAGWTLDHPDAAAITAAVAGRIPPSPPSSWFDRTSVPDGAPLTFTEDGRVYGLLAPNNVDHIGLVGQKVRAPRSRSGYSYFHTGQVRCDDGSLVATGRITMLTGHEPDEYASPRTAAAHYDDTGTAVADVVAWDSPAGTMCAGAARPGLTPEHIRMAMASPPSGDWRPIGADHEMVGALLVNVPGFPVRRSLAASAAEVEREGALVATGGPPPVITITSSAQEAPMSDTTSTSSTTTETPPAPAAVVAAGTAAHLPAERLTGIVASIDGDRAKVEVDVPLADLEPAGPDAVALLAAGQRQRVFESSVTQRLDAITASVEQSQRRADTAEGLRALDGIPEDAEGN